LQYVDESGKKRDKYRRIAAKREARNVVDSMRAEVNTHGSEVLHSDRMTFAELADLYETVRVVPAVFANGIKVSGKKSVGPIKSQLKSLKAHFGKRLIRTMKVSDIDQYKSKRLSTPVVVLINQSQTQLNGKSPNRKRGTIKVEEHRPRSITSVNRELQTLRAMFNFAIENDWLIKNPVSKRKGIISIAAELKRDRVLSYAEEERLLAACTGRRSHLLPILICALDTGMRRGEMFKMKWSDINFDKDQIMIPQSNTKTESSRMVGLTARLRKVLMDLLEQSPRRPNGLVFGISNTVKNAWKAALQDADISDFRLHDCRHTATTRMIASGSPHTEVMKVTGHTQMSTFLRYLNITAETTQRVAGHLDAYLGTRIGDVGDIHEDFVN
jgi:integrase